MGFVTWCFMVKIVSRLKMNFTSISCTDQLTPKLPHASLCTRAEKNVLGSREP